MRACRGTREGSSFEVFTLRHTLCRSHSKVEVSALSSTPKFEGGPARDPDGARVARRVEEIIMQRRNIVGFTISKGCNFGSVVASVSEPWLQAHPSDQVEPRSISPTGTGEAIAPHYAIPPS